MKPLENESIYFSEGFNNMPGNHWLADNIAPRGETKQD